MLDFEADVAGVNLARMKVLVNIISIDFALVMRVLIDLLLIMFLVSVVNVNCCRA